MSPSKGSESEATEGERRLLASVLLGDFRDGRLELESGDRGFSGELGARCLVVDL